MVGDDYANKYADCGACGEVVQADTDGMTWYHVESYSMACDPEGEHRIDRMAYPIGATIRELERTKG